MTPYHDTNDVNRGGPHGWDDSQEIADGGKMDGFLKESYKGIGIRDNRLAPRVQPGKPKDVMGWHDYHEIPNYWNYARAVCLQDRMFESVASYSLPAHLVHAGCPKRRVYWVKQPEPTAYNFPEITELLTSGTIDWKYYVTSGKLPDTEDR